MISELDATVEQLISELRQDLGFTPEQMQGLLQDGEIFEMIGKGLAEHLISQQNEGYVSGWLQTARHNQQTIIDEHPKLFQYYFLFIHAVREMFRNLKKVLHDQDVDLSDMVLFTLLGTLCRLGDEIGTLLTNGATRTALALYRTLYEHAVVGIFLMKKDDALLYRKFADYGHKDVRKKADSLDNHYETLKFPPLDPARRQEIEARSKELEALYGKDFFKDYGWAKAHLSERPTFWAVEQEAGMARYRPFYIWVSQFTHPSYQALADIRTEAGHFALGKLTEQDIERRAFVDPMQLTITSLYLFIEEFLHKYGAEHQYQANMQIFHQLMERLMDSFDDPPMEGYPSPA